MNIENLSTLKIHKLTQAQYSRELEAGNIDPSALYLTPDENDSNIYVQNDEPIDAENGSLWIDTDAVSGNSSSSGGGSNNSDSNSGSSVDLSNYALKSEISKKVSQLTNDSKYITESSMQTIKTEIINEVVAQFTNVSEVGA